MAERRMFAKTITESDAFLDMPSSTQNLYFHLNMSADDDGFVNNPKKVQRMIGSSDDDLKILCAKSFLIPFDSGVVVIKHWRISNYLRSDRYKPTVYQDEFEQLDVKDNKAYTQNNSGIPMVAELVDSRETQVSIGKDRIGKVNEDTQDNHAIVIPSKQEVNKDNQFQIFYTSYPKKTNKTDANKAFDKLIKSGVTLDYILSKLKVYEEQIARDKIESKYIRNPQRFLNTLDDYELPVKQEASSVPKPPTCPKCGALVEFGQCTDCGIFIDLDGKEVVL